MRDVAAITRTSAGPLLRGGVHSEAVNSVAAVGILPRPGAAAIAITPISQPSIVKGLTIAGRRHRLCRNLRKNR